MAVLTDTKQRSLKPRPAVYRVADMGAVHRGSPQRFSGLALAVTS